MIHAALTAALWLALATIPALCVIGHRRCRQDALDNALRDAASGEQTTPDQNAEPSVSTWGHSVANLTEEAA